MNDKAAAAAVAEVRIAKIRDALRAEFDTDDIQIVDNTWRHRKHAGAQDGRGHFDVTIVSPKFAGQRPLARHRMVYDVLDGLLKTDIHALSIRALVPDESAPKPT